MHVDTEAAHENLVNARLGYVPVSRARDDAKIYTNDAASLGEALSREVSKPSALDAEANTDASQSKEHTNDERPASHESAHSRGESEQAEAHANEEQRAPHEAERSQGEREHTEEREQAQEHGVGF